MKIEHFKGFVQISRPLIELLLYIIFLVLCFKNDDKSDPICFFSTALVDHLRNSSNLHIRSTHSRHGKIYLKIITKTRFFLHASVMSCTDQQVMINFFFSFRSIFLIKTNLCGWVTITQMFHFTNHVMKSIANECIKTSVKHRRGHSEEYLREGCRCIPMAMTWHQPDTIIFFV